jgi:hypothetical protein
MYFPYLLLIFLASSFQVFSAALSIEGSYQGKNLYIQNPLSSDGVGYCATKVTVNGDILPATIGQETIEVDFSLFGSVINDPVFIVVEHNEGCLPIFINPEVLLPKSTFETTSIFSTSEGELTWKTTNENGKLNFWIEQFQWNKWVVVGEVQGKGSAGTNTYQFQLRPHSGVNTVRVAQRDHSGTKRVSDPYKFTSNVSKVIKAPSKVKDKIYFTSGGKSVETRYEIFDAYGNILKKGVGSFVNCSKLINGAYYINFDNTSEKFIKTN